MYRMHSLLLSAALALTLIGLPDARAGELKVGDPAPDFELPGSDGKTYKLSTFRGSKAVVVAWFPKAMTGGCTRECKSMRDSGKQLREFKVAYFTASCDKPELNKKFAEQLEVDYPILSDPGRKTAEQYGVVNKKRKVPFRWTFIIGKDGKILHIDKKVKVASHGADIAKKLADLKVEKAG